MKLEWFRTLTYTVHYVHSGTINSNKPSNLKGVPPTAVPERSTFWIGGLFGRLSKPFRVMMVTCEPVSYKKSIVSPQVFILIIVLGASLKPFQTFMIWVFAYSAKAKHSSCYCINKTQTIHSKFHSTLQSRNNSHFRFVKMLKCNIRKNTFYC